MGGVERDKLRALDRVGDRFAGRRRRCRILLADDDKRRRRHLWIGGAEIHVADRLDAGDVALGIGGGEHVGHAPHDLRRALAKALGEPALHVRADQLLETLLAHELDAVGPWRLVGVIEIGVGEHQLLDAVRRVGAEPLAVHAAHRQAAPVDLVDLERIEDGEDVAAETVETVRPLGHAGLAVAAAVVADEAEVLGEVAGLVVPHMQVGAERIRQHQRRRVVVALDLDIDRAAVVGLDHRHEIPPPGASYWSVAPTLKGLPRGLQTA